MAVKLLALKLQKFANAKKIFVCYKDVILPSKFPK